jgi:hypothetical protein
MMYNNDHDKESEFPNLAPPGKGQICRRAEQSLLLVEEVLGAQL